MQAGKNKETNLVDQQTHMASSVKQGFILTSKILLFLAFAIWAFNVDYGPVTGGLDPSWQYIINYGFDQRIEFSFTSGPLGFINYPLNIGSNLEIAVITRIFFWLGVSGWLGFLILKDIFPLWNLFLCVCLFTLGNQISFDYMVCFVILLLLSCAVFFPRKWLWAYGIVIGLSASLALVKLSAAILAIASCAMFSVVMLWVDRKKALLAVGLMCVGIPLLFGIFYLVYDPSLSRMITYIKRAFDIASGYNVAMSLSGWPVALWLALAIAIAYGVQTLLLLKLHRKAGLLGIIYFPAIFLTFKHGFVRQDGHETAFFMALSVLFGLLWLFTPLTKRTWAMLVLLLPVLVTRLGVPAYSTEFESVVGVPKFVVMSELLNYHQTKEELDAVTTEFLQWYQLPSEWTRLMGQQTVSIFPWETGYAPANKLNYRPFPVIQAYSAYTAYLDSENAHFLAQSSSAPDFILMQWVAIDYRHILIDVPEMWLEFYRWYDVVKHEQNPFPLSLLKRREQPRFNEIQFLDGRTYGTDDVIEILSSDHPVLMKMHMELTMFGKLTKLFFRVPAVTMELMGTNGNPVYRIVPDTLSNPLFINVLPISLLDVSTVLNDSQWRNRLSGVRLSGKGLSLYRQQIQVEFYQIPGIFLTQVAAQG